MFIELTTTDKYGEVVRLSGNVNLLQRVYERADKTVMVAGWNNNGGFDVLETYDEVMAKIKAAKSNAM